MITVKYYTVKKVKIKVHFFLSNTLFSLHLRSRPDIVLYYKYVKSIDRKMKR